MDNPQTTLEEELGKRADSSMVKKLSTKIASSWNLKEKITGPLFVLILGGFQGAGKTTVLNLLRKDNLITISPDQIRHELFSSGTKFSNKFIHTVNATRNNLLRIALSKKRNIAIDQFVTPGRLKVVEKIIAEYKDYKIIKILLTADKQTLVQRVRNRTNTPGLYRGTVDELEDSINKYGEPDPQQYDKVFDAQKLSPFEISKKIGELLQA